MLLYVLYVLYVIPLCIPDIVHTRHLRDVCFYQFILHKYQLMNKVLCVPFSLGLGKKVYHGTHINISCDQCRTKYLAAGYRSVFLPG